LNETRVSDAGLVQLYGLSNLETVNLFFTKVTDKSGEALRRALPKAHITWRRGV
jgi:hypothetical protein